MLWKPSAADVPRASMAAAVTSGTTTPPPPSMPSRDVARPVANLGNTCYMNAVLQALAHAPELCMAMDCEPHRSHCPIAMEISQKRRLSPSSSPDADNRRSGHRKSRRSGKRSPSSENSNGEKFCALCSVEEHLDQVHCKRDDPVAPSTFVHGFIDHVAPWFKLGVQEDSHEFLRLLIDAMQKSCHQARTTTTNNSNHGHDAPLPVVPLSSRHDDEYPFSLFRGTVESNVTCDSCRHSSSTLDPIEDIGLEVTPCTPLNSNATSNNNAASSNSALADVSCAFQRFARVEDLDAGYKCEKCGKVGKATKQSRLASIPPILTLHLKRFRYGEAKSTATSGGAVRRTGRSEVSQLLGSAAGDYYTGKSGSAKIEGHVKFEEIFDLQPYLTEGLQAKHSNMMCRLFAVIVHSGKSSHSGHYIAYVRNHSKNEWWKMDDARVQLVSKEEVMNAEAYMLFYRVVEHPIAVQLRMRHTALLAKQKAPITVSAVVSMTTPEDTVSLITDTATIVSNTEELVSMSVVSATSTRTLRSKRKAPFTNGEEWARAKTRLPPHLVGLLARAEEFVTDAIDFKVEFSELLRAEANRDGAEVGKCSLEVCEEDVKGGADKVHRVLVDFFWELAKQLEKNGGDPNILFDIRKHILAHPTSKEKKFMVPLVDPDDTYL